jgi:DNA primase
LPIPERFIDELVARCDIVDLVSDYVTLTKKGGSLWGLCPFHSEKTPSFHVVPDRQIYKCFGCGKGGGAINFVMEMENLPFLDAVRLLAKRVGLEVPEDQENGDYRRRREHLLALNKEAARYFHSQLTTPDGAAGAAYLAGRALSKGTITRFGLGCAPEGWDRLITAMAAKGYDKRDLLDAGLAVNGQNGRIYDRFRNRVMFPIIDLRGDVIGFGGRVLDDGSPKYLNSPDTVVFNKSRNLFALNLARKSKLGRIILTEGYMDTISLHQAGFDCAVASLGTALTPDHAQLLARYTKEAVIAYDGDGAGVAAAQRAIPLLERTGLKVKVLRMKGAKDPDEFIKTYGREAFAKLLDQSENHIEYRLGQLMSQYDLSDDVQKIECSRQAAGLVASLQSPVEREVYGARCAEAVGISAEAMAQEVARQRQQRLQKEKRKQERRDLTPAAQLQPKDRTLRYTNVKSARAEEGVLRLILLDPALLEAAGELEEDQFSAPFLGRVFTLLRRRWEEGRLLQLPALAGELTGEEMAWLSGILQQPEALEHGRQAMADYIAVIQTEATKRTGESGMDPLLAAREKYREKKKYGG